MASRILISLLLKLPIPFLVSLSNKIIIPTNSFCTKIGEAIAYSQSTFKTLESFSISIISVFKVLFRFFMKSIFELYN